MTDCPGVHPEPEPGNPWCPRCRSRIHQRVWDLQILAAMHEHATDGYGEAPDQPGPCTNGHPPSPSPGFDTRDEIERMLRGWEAAYLDIRGWGTPPVHGRHATVSYEITVFLSRHFTSIIESPFALEFGQEVLGAAWELAFKAKATSMRKIGRVPCPRCDHIPLVSADGGEVYWCAVCGRPVRKDEYGELCRLAAPANA